MVRIATTAEGNSRRYLRFSLRDVLMLVLGLCFAKLFLSGTTMTYGDAELSLLRLTSSSAEASTTSVSAAAADCGDGRGSDWNRVPCQKESPYYTTPAPGKNNEEHKIYDGGYITRILRGELSFPEKSDQPLKYRPGTLQMSTAQSFQYCYVNKTIYRGHIGHTRPTDKLAPVSVRYKLIDLFIPKSASSTSRAAMRDGFNATEKRLNYDDLKTNVNKLNFSVVTFIREPLDRFYSAYDEAFLRVAPWHPWSPWNKSNSVNNKFPYPYLFEGIKNEDDFRQLFCPDEILRSGKYKNIITKLCDEAESVDANLTLRFERFVHDYNGSDPFDVHLTLQVLHLINSSGEPLPISHFYNASEAKKDWGVIANNFGVNISEGGDTHARKRSRKFNVDLVSVATKQKICRLMALDYCCLNIELPVFCREEGGDGVFCAMERKNWDVTQEAKSMIIRSWDSF
eukprot:scaffold31521_cov55-Attheya_sp.AAC.5